MKKKYNRKTRCTSLSLLVLLFFQSCNIKGANEPNSLAPSTSHTPWTPPENGLKKVSTQDLQKEVEDYEAFSKQTPISLAQIIDIALYNSPTTKKSWAEARVSAGRYGKSLHKEFILADVEGKYMRTRSANFHDKENPTTYETEYGPTLHLTYTILDFGQTRYSTQSALESLYRANWSHNSKIQTTIQKVMRDYYNYLLSKELLSAAEQDVLNAQVSLDATEEKFRQGLTDVSDIVQAKTSYLQQKLTVVDQKQTLHHHYTTLVNAMGLSSSGVLFFQHYPKTIETFDIETLDSLILQANANRPDLFAAQSNVKSKIAYLQATKAKKFPLLMGNFDIGSKYGQHGRTDNYDFRAQLNLTFPLFQGFFIENSIKVAQARLEKAHARLKEVKLEMIQEVSNYRDDVIFSRESLHYARAYLESAQEGYKVALKKYQVGTGTIVELINAQTNIFDARSQLIKAQSSWYTSIANLAYATGLLFSPQ